MMDLANRAASNDWSALFALNKQGEWIGRGLRMVNAALSPEVILFAGDITTVWEITRSAIERECNAGVLTDSLPSLRSIGDGELALLRGAAAVVLQRHTGYYRSAHGKHARDTVTSRA